MRVPRTLLAYMTLEILLYGGLAYVAIVTVLVSQNLLRRLDELLVVGFSAADLTSLSIFLFLMLAAYATPIAFLFGVSLAFSRLSSDSEILAMRASGLGLRQLLAAPVGLALTISALTAWQINAVEPSAQRNFRTLVKAVAARGGVLEPGRFKSVLGRVIFVERRDRDNRLSGIVIDDANSSEEPFTIFADRGRFVLDEAAGRIRIELEHGSVHVAPSRESPERYQRIAFERLTYGLGKGGMLGDRSFQRRPRDMSIPELRESSALLRAGERPTYLREKNPADYELELHRRIALPLAPVLFALVAVPLGLRRAGSARSWGALIALGLVFVYYSLMSFGSFLAREEWLGAFVASWLPNGVLAAMAWWLMRRARRGLLL